jgi:hypothetical protein
LQNLVGNALAHRAAGMYRAKKSLLPIAALAVAAAGFRLIGQPAVADLLAIGYLIVATVVVGRPLPLLRHGSAAGPR